MKKILYVWKGAYPWDIRIAKICKSLVEAGYDVTILARHSDEEKSEEFIDGIKIVRMGKGSKKLVPLFCNPFWKWAVEEAIAKEKPDIIIVREMLIAEQVAKAAKKHKIPIIMDMAEHYPGAIRDWKKYNSNSIKRFIVHSLKLPDIIERRSVAMMDGIFTVCQENSERLHQQYGYDLSKTTVVHNTPQFLSIPANKPINPDFITLGHHGYMTAEKSLTNFIIGFCQYVKKAGNARFIIAGDGTCTEEYMQIVNDFQAGEYVEFTGEYNHQDLSKILDRIDIGVVPYQLSDFNNYTIHNKIFDYWALCKPVITSETLPFKRVMSETNAGLTIDCESAEAVEKWLSKNLITQSWVDYAENARHFAQSKYNWEQDIQNLIVFWEKNWGN